MSLQRNIISTFITQFPVIITGVITGIFITRTLGVDGKGTFAIFSANIQLLALFTGISINTGLVYFISNKKIQLNKILGIAIYALITGSIIGSLIVFTPVFDFISPINYTSINYRVYLYLSFVLMLVNTIFIGIFQGKRFYSNLNKIAIINSILNLILFALLFFTKYVDILKTKMDNVFLFSLIILVVNSTLYFVLYRLKIKELPSMNLNIRKEVFPFYKYISLGYLSQLINFFNYRLDLWFVNKYGISTDVGYYALAVNGAQFLLLISNPIGMVIFSYLSNEKDNEKKTDILTFFSRINSTGLILLTILLFLIGDVLITKVYGAEFSGSVEVFKIMLIATMFLGFSKTFSTYLASENKIKYNLLATSTGFSITLVFNIILIPRYGIFGAAYTSLMTYFTIFAIVYYKTIRLNSSVPLNCFIITKNDILKTIKDLL